MVIEPLIGFFLLTLKQVFNLSEGNLVSRWVQARIPD